MDYNREEKMSISGSVKFYAGYRGHRLTHTEQLNFIYPRCSDGLTKDQNDLIFF